MEGLTASATHSAQAVGLLPEGPPPAGVQQAAELFCLSRTLMLRVRRGWRTLGWSYCHQARRKGKGKADEIIRNNNNNTHH